MEHQALLAKGDRREDRGADPAVAICESLTQTAAAVVMEGLGETAAAAVILQR
jgi:hypothetical protein